MAAGRDEPSPVAGDARRAAAYDERFHALARSGADVHGEANFVASLGGGSVLDAGCGTGRVAIELARRGLEVVGVDRDAAMLAAARAKAPTLEWLAADLADVSVTDAGGALRRFDTVVLAGNVMIFLTPGSEAAVVANLVRHLRPAGRLVAGFQLRPGGLGLAAYDAIAVAAGLVLEGRWATWDRAPFAAGGDYAVSLHRLAA
ncbi:MAG: class I SAM-dependent methyltransferase [Actinomycetota bacterium]|nr:class I SAM-dependent methyltransferase [Actinomycetota bacterium]